MTAEEEGRIVEELPAAQQQKAEPFPPAPSQGGPDNAAAEPSASEAQGTAGAVPESARDAVTTMEAAPGTSETDHPVQGIAQPGKPDGEVAT